jgi:hypothetical protein
MADSLTAAMAMEGGQAGASLANTIDSIYMRHESFKENKRQFDQTFNEDVRQFGLRYVLEDFATRQNVSLAKAKQLYDAENLALNKQVTGENVKTSALGRTMQATQFNWAKDRAKQQRFGKALEGPRFRVVQVQNERLFQAGDETPCDEACRTGAAGRA